MSAKKKTIRLKTSLAKFWAKCRANALGDNARKHGGQKRFALAQLEQDAEGIFIALLNNRIDDVPRGPAALVVAAHLKLGSVTLPEEHPTDRKVDQAAAELLSVAVAIEKGQTETATQSGVAQPVQSDADAMDSVGGLVAACILDRVETLRLIAKDAAQGRDEILSAAADIIEGNPVEPRLLVAARAIAIEQLRLIANVLIDDKVSGPLASAAREKLLEQISVLEG